MPDTNEDLRLIDLATLVPLLGSSLAISWEVGKFFPSGGFELFSLSDHFVSAMPALPVAVALALILASLFSIASIQSRILLSRSSGRFVTGIVLLGPILAGYIFMGIWKNSWANPAAIICVGGFLLYTLNLTVLNYPMKGAVGSAFLYLLAVLLSMTVSSNRTQGRIERADDLEDLSTITTKSGSYQAYVLMAGERGLLAYDPLNKLFRFQRADEIVGFDWKVSR